MSSVLNLESFLIGESATDTLRGTGAFSESVQQAHQRFLGLDFPSSGIWVSRLLQAAVGWASPEVQVSQSRYATSFYFTPEVEVLPSGTEIFRTLLHGHFHGSRPLERFCVTLRAIREQAGLAFLLILDNGDGQPLVISDGRHFARMSRRRRLKPEYYKGPGISLSVSHVHDSETRVEHVFRRTRGITRSVSISNKVVELSELYPAPLFLDSRRLDDLWSSPAWKNVSENDLLAVVGLPRAQESRGPRFRLPEAVSCTSARKTFWSLCPEDADWIGYLLVCCRVGASWSEIVLVQDGVPVHRMPLFGQFPVGFRLILDASEQVTDPSGCRLVESDALAEYLRLALKLSLEAVDRLRRHRHLPPHLAHFFDQDSTTVMAIFSKAMNLASRNFPRHFSLSTTKSS